MTIEWTDEAIDAALSEWFENGSRSTKNDMRAALDAAVKAQGVGWVGVPHSVFYAKAFEDGVVSTFQQRAKDLEDIAASSRAEALEEAAVTADGYGSYTASEAIRTLIASPTVKS